MSDADIYIKLNKLNAELKKEVNDFIDLLLLKKQNKKFVSPQFSSLKGSFTISPDFDEPLNDFKDYR